MGQLTFFPVQPDKAAKGGTLGRSTRMQLMNPCEGCGLNHRRRVDPILPKNPLLLAVGVAPGGDESACGEPFIGESGQILREILKQLGLVVGVDIGLMNLTRCQPESAAEARMSNQDIIIQNMFEAPSWLDAQRRCSTYLKSYLMNYPNTPILALGTEPLQYFLRNQKLFIAKNRGFRRKAYDGRVVFTTWNPAHLLHRENPDEQARLYDELTRDIANAVAMIRGTAQPTEVSYKVYTRQDEIIAYAKHLAIHPGPWAFDIESYDAHPAFGRSRPGVATDPLHPDYRVRGLGIATSPRAGAFLELAPHERSKKLLQPFLAAAFASGADKEAANGHFDEEGLICQGWVPEILNRTGDSMLAMLALADGRLAGYSLERGVIDILREFYHWSDVDKALIQSLPLAVVADGCVRDACATRRICNKLHAMMEQGAYLS